MKRVFWYFSVMWVIVGMLLLLVPSGAISQALCDMDPTQCGVTIEQPDKPEVVEEAPKAGVPCGQDDNGLPIICDVDPQDPADIPPLSIQVTGVLSIMELRENYECRHPDGELFREHWLASGYYIDYCNGVAHVLTAQRDLALEWLDECRNPPEPEIPCDLWRDWSGGNLWKPVSDNTGQVVVLTKDEASQYADCDYLGPDGERQFGCSFRTIANGGREHWNLPYCDDIKRDGAFRLTEDGVRRCWEVPNPCNRYD